MAPRQDSASSTELGEGTDAGSAAPPQQGAPNEEPAAGAEAAAAETAAAPELGAPVIELDEQTQAALAGHMEGKGDDDILDSALCMVCTNHTFGDAVAVTASCGHPFHPKCIEDAMKREKTKCPCGAVFPPGREPIVPFAPMLKRMMNKAKVQCPRGTSSTSAGTSLGCGEVIPFGNLHEHVHNAGGCPNTPYRCGNPGCGVLFLRKDKDEHLGSCPHRLVPCTLCQQPIHHLELLQHKAGQCPRRKVRCPHCEGEHCFIDKDLHMRGCTGAVQMMNLEELRVMMLQLRDQVAECQHVNECQGEIMFEQQQTIERQGQTIERQGQTIERQQREIAELQERDVRREEERFREELFLEERFREERERVAVPQRLTVSWGGQQSEYSLRPERVNGAAVWGGNGNWRLYRSRGGYWGLTHEADGPQRNLGNYRLTSQPGSPAPLSARGWEYSSHRDMSRADGWLPYNHFSVRVKAS